MKRLILFIALITASCNTERKQMRTFIQLQDSLYREDLKQDSVREAHYIDSILKHDNK